MYIIVCTRKSVYYKQIYICVRIYIYTHTYIYAYIQTNISYTQTHSYTRTVFSIVKLVINIKSNDSTS